MEQKSGNMKIFIFLISLHFLSLRTNALKHYEEQKDVHIVPTTTSLSTSLYAGKGIHVPTKTTPSLSVYCWNGEFPLILSLWKSTTFVIRIDKDEFELYKGLNATDVEQQFKEHQSAWFNIWPWKVREVALSPFNKTCIGVYTRHEYDVKLDVRRLDFRKVLMFAVGLALFLLAPQLCRNVAFHYSSAVAIGILASVLIAVYLFSRLIPKKTGSYVVLIGGWSLTVYLAQTVWENLHTILLKYQPYVVAYIAVCGLVSFVVFYRFGPVSDPRTISLLQWGLQVLGFFLMFSSSAYHEATVAILLVLLSVYNVPVSWTAKARSAWLRRFPPAIKYLSEEEYLEQSTKETKKALDDLRNFCQSPQCNAWKTMKRLKDPLRYVPDSTNSQKGPSIGRYHERASKPVRFAEFVQGSSHLLDQELLEYESDSVTHMDDDGMYTDDDSA